MPLGQQSCGGLALPGPQNGDRGQLWSASPRLDFRRGAETAEQSPSPPGPGPLCPVLQSGRKSPLMTSTMLFLFNSQAIQSISYCRGLGNNMRNQHE